MNSRIPSSKLFFIIFPALTMLLGWGLRGYIGGGPFGAMIPGALVVLAICILLDLPAAFSAILVVFGTMGIGFGGEMTYGQTLGFLRHPETVYWGILGTAVKGSVWGLLGGSFIALGMLYRKLGLKTVIIAFLVILAGLSVGLLLVNDPKLIYFSDPVNKPRSESWAGLLFAGLFLLAFLWFKASKDDFLLVRRFALFGFIGGGLGFGLGGLWMVLGSKMPPDIYFKSWWKMMEFTFGLILGGALGYASWLCREQIKLLAAEAQYRIHLPRLITEMAGLFVLAVLLYMIIPYPIEYFLDNREIGDGFFGTLLYYTGRMVVNFVFLGCLLVVIGLNKPWLLWQIAVSITFCHTVIDFVVDLKPENGLTMSGPAMVFFVVITTMIVAYLAAKFQRESWIKRSMFLLLTWACMVPAYLKLVANPILWLPAEGTDSFFGRLTDVIIAHLPVHAIFTLSAIAITWMAIKISKGHKTVSDSWLHL